MLVVKRVTALSIYAFPFQIAPHFNCTYLFSSGMNIFSKTVVVANFGQSSFMTHPLFCMPRLKISYPELT